MHPTPSPTAGGASPQIEVGSWADLAHLPDVVHELGGQVAEIMGHAQRWVASTEGFEPSPVCVLRPLVPVLEQVAQAFGDVGSALTRELDELACGVARSYAELRGADDDARRSCGGRS